MEPKQFSEGASYTCRVCDASLSEGRKYQIREMYFGTRETFSYLECPACGSLQLEEIPADLSRFYPSNYYTQSAPTVGGETVIHRTRYFLRGQLTLRQLGRRNLLGGLVNLLHPKKNELPRWLDGRLLHLTLNSRILDVGCGNGALLARLRRFGFHRLEGVEPFSQAAVDNGPVSIHRVTLEQFAGTGYDLIMLHHVMEHLPNPASVMKQLAGMLAPDGCLLIRIPVAGCLAWRQYGTNWVQLDAPRHAVLFTPAALKQLAARCGLQPCGMYYDSGPFQFWGSEQYQRDIPLEDPRSVGHEQALGSFTQPEMDDFARKSDEANRNHEGDQAVFYFKLAAREKKAPVK